MTWSTNMEELDKIEEYLNGLVKAGINVPDDVLKAVAEAKFELSAALSHGE